ncbi:M48 family metallopeptidase [Pendulispora brunnea]|uniref:M48 family metallopeptidase n=1 Tax=Pendulispora brunnea TaxID=2905690 RepID=A0ABZ2KCR5_9BACT
MKGMGQRWSWAVVVWTLSVALLGVVPRARADAASDAAFEKKVLDDIRAENPDAVPVFTEAMAASKRRDLPAAIAAMGRVVQLAPKSDHAHRRLCNFQMAADQDASGLSHCRRALELRDAPENHSALASALVEAKGATKLDIDSALDHASRGLKDRAGDRHAIASMLGVQMAARNEARIKQYLAQLDNAAGDDPDFHAMAAGIHTALGEMDAARDQLQKAKALGLSEERSKELSSFIDEREHSGIGYYIKLIAWVFGLWAAGFAFLLGLGWLLSQSVLRAAERMSGQQGAPAPSWLRRVYRAVIWLTCIYFYASLPIVLVGVFVAAGAILFAIVAFGYIPIKLVLIIGLIALVSFAAVMKALWALVAPGKQKDPGEPLDLAAEPKLRALLREVADKVGTRMVDRVYLTTGTQLAVTERGGGWLQVRGKTERCLLVGAAVLEGMPIRAFKAILAHEYGHFKNEDTAGGGFALAMQRSLITMALSLARGGAANAMSPAWWFVRGFHLVFLRISHGASRLQEILADRWAALAYGSASFERGLRHVIERSVRFDAHANAALKEVLEKQVPLANFYAYAPEAAASETELADALDKALGRPASPYDSHPPPHQRIAWVNALAASGDPAQPDEEEGDAWTLFSDRTGIEERMTGVIRTSLANDGILLPPVPERA